MHLPLLVGACWIWMYCHVFDIICLKTNFLHTGHHTSANREAGFPWLQQMKESNQPNSHKKSRFPFWGPLRRKSTAVIPTVHTCVCIDHANVRGIQASWEISSKLDFKQTWPCLMRCWSGVQICSHRMGQRKGLPAWPILTRRIILLRSGVHRGDEQFRSPVM